MERLSNNAILDLALCTTDIGGAAAVSRYFDMQHSDSISFLVQLGCPVVTSGSELGDTGWDALDTLNTCTLLQATDAYGAGSKALGGGPTVPDPAAAGQKYTMEAKAIDLDIVNSFRYVAASVAETGNTGTDNVTIFAVRHNLDVSYQNVTGATARGYA